MSSKCLPCVDSAPKRSTLVHSQWRFHCYLSRVFWTSTRYFVCLFYPQSKLWTIQNLQMTYLMGSGISLLFAWRCVRLFFLKVCIQSILRIIICSVRTYGWRQAPKILYKWHRNLHNRKNLYWHLFMDQLKYRIGSSEYWKI